MINKTRGRVVAWLFPLLLLSSLHTWAGSISESIDAFLSEAALAHGIQGVVIESLKDGRVIYERNRHLVFIPASNMKLIVSATALVRLGPDYTYTTTLYRTGRVRNGVLYGDLVLKGDGDPLLMPSDLKAMIADVKRMGIRRVNGRVLGDDTKFDDARLGCGWNWDDEPYYYSAQISALSLNENVVNVYVKPGKRVGAPASIALDPPTSYVTVRNHATTGAARSEKTVAVDRLRGKNVIRVTGSIPVDYESKEPEEPITVEEPALFAATVLREMLIKEGISVSGPAMLGRVPLGAASVSSRASLPLKAILARLNKPSDNLIAELLLKTLGAKIKGKGTTAAGREVEMEFLKNEVGADIGEIAIVDGSGLSRLNYVSPDVFVKLLRYMYAYKDARDYLDSLPIAGVDGTLRRRMKGTGAEGNVRAKTGYVSRVSSLSGYVTTKGGEPLVFSMLMNNHLCRNSEATAVQDKICAFLAGLE